MDFTRTRPGDVKAVFFDLGKVILRFNHEDIVERLLSRARPEDRRPRELFTFLFDAKAGLCNRYDEGTISSRDFYGEIDKRFRLNMDFEVFASLWNGIFTEDVEVTALMAEVRSRRPVYLLSNVNELHWEHARERFPSLSAMDGWVLSYRVRAKKPRPEIYRAALEVAGAGPGESVFIDDLPENTAAAAGCGIYGITFTGIERLREDLDALGLLG
ncbi:MAG TPA: HAD family phosphatase [Nitrospirota bacterium]|nr:HAD family phosphatase [Nitrospirota bacterium]